MPRIIHITDLSLPELAPYTRLTEAQLRSKRHPEKGLFIAESKKVLSCALDCGYVPRSLLMEERQIPLCQPLLERCGDIPLYTAPREVLAELTGFALTRGILAAMARPAPHSVEEVCADATRIAVLENIVDPTNLGAIFRSAAALGMEAVLVTPACCDPLHRRAVRVSMGTVFQVPWARLECWPEKGLAHLHSMGFRTAAMALQRDSLDISSPVLAAAERLAVILGTEGDGLLPLTLDLCDHTVYIPMCRGVDSLNVAAASAVAFWTLGKH